MCTGVVLETGLCWAHHCIAACTNRHTVGAWKYLLYPRKHKELLLAHRESPQGHCCLCGPWFATPSAGGAPGGFGLIPTLSSLAPGIHTLPWLWSFWAWPLVGWMPFPAAGQCLWVSAVSATSWLVPGLHCTTGVGGGIHRSHNGNGGPQSWAALADIMASSSTPGHPRFREGLALIVTLAPQAS